MASPPTARTLHVDGAPVRVYSLAIAAGTLGMKERTLARQARDGQLRGVQAWRPSTEPNPFPHWYFRADDIDAHARTQGGSIVNGDDGADELQRREENLRRREETLELQEKFVATNRVADLEMRVETLLKELEHERAQRAAAESELQQVLRLFADSINRRNVSTEAQPA